MDHKEKTVKSGAWSTHHYDRDGHGTEKVGEKRHSLETSDTGGGEERSSHGPHGEVGGSGDDKIETSGKKTLITHITGSMVLLVTSLKNMCLI